MCSILPPDDSPIRAIAMETSTETAPVKSRKRKRRIENWKRNKLKIATRDIPA